MVLMDGNLLKNYAQKRIKIVKEKDLYKIKNLIFISIEYEQILDTKKFFSKELFNIHFSLTKYRGCHTNYLQIKNGEKYSGVTIHKIDRGIDTGNIIDQIKYKVDVNTDALGNYNKLMHFSVLIFVKNFKKIILRKYTQKKQNNKKSSYFSRKFVNYDKEKFITKKENSLKFHNRIRALIFPPFQLPIFNGKKNRKKLYLKKKGSSKIFMIDFFNISRQDKSFHKKIVNDITKIINSNDFINESCKII